MSTATTTTYTEGQKVRILGNSNSHSFKTGDIVELVENVATGYDGCWLATTDPAVRYWNHREASNVMESDIEPAIQVGVRVKGKGIWSGRDRQGVVVEINETTVTIKEDGDPFARPMLKIDTVELLPEPVVVTVEDFLALGDTLRDAEKALAEAQAEVDRANEALEAAVSFRDGAHSALTDAIAAFNG